MVLIDGMMVLMYGIMTVDSKNVCVLWQNRV